MKEAAHSAILNREEPEAHAAKHLAPQLELLADLADYGSNLVIRAFNSSQKQMAEIIACGVLLKQVVAMVDAVQVLLSAGCGHAAFLPARSAWEASLYLDWILSGDSERRASCYLVGNYRDERFWVARVTPGTPEESAFSQISKSIGLDVLAERPTLVSEAERHLAEVNRVLAQPSLQAIDIEFQEVRGKRKRDPEWYELDGMKSIREIAKTLDRLAEYEAFYARGSQVTHTGTYKDHVRFADGQVRFKPIRHLADVNLLLNFTISVAFGTYKRVLERYRPGEIGALTKKYAEDWRTPFLNVTQIKYDF
jgi:hypothetical protein